MLQKLWFYTELQKLFYTELKHVSKLNYLRRCIAYKRNEDLTKKVSRYLQGKEMTEKIGI